MKLIRSLSIAFALLMIFASLAVLTKTAFAQEEDDHEEDDHSPVELNNVVINEFCTNTTDKDAEWIELYNPSNYSKNLTHYKLWTGNVLTPGGAYFDIIEDPQNTTNHMLEPDSYIIICENITTFQNYWGTTDSSNMIQMDYMRGTIPGYFGLWPSGYKFNCPPSISGNHSWARYTGGYSYGSFEEDFYDESHPTPGYENHQEFGEEHHEEEHGISSDEMMMNLGVVFGAIIVFCLVVIFYPRK